MRPLFLEYAASLSFDLGFQDFEREVEEPPGEYAPPAGGAVARAGGRRAGGLRRPASARRRRLRAEAPLRPALGARPRARQAASRRRRSSCAAELGYRAIRLDTTPEMAAAHELYRTLGFREIEPYRENPVPGTRYLELDLVGE